MKALRVQVERVVRPIRASSWRKDRMREELLAHLTRLFDEELARTDDAEQATAEAIRRFGDATSLTRELQASVTWLERVAFYSFPKSGPIFRSGPIRRRAGESPVRYILRANAWGFALGSAFYVLIAVVVATIARHQPHRADQPALGQLLMLLWGNAVIQFAAVISLGLLGEGMRRELERRTAATSAVEKRSAIWRTVGYAATSSAVVGASFAGLMLLVEMFLPIPLITRGLFWWVTASAAVLGLPLALWQAWSWKATNRRFENWDSLDLDQKPPA